jgi:hypothetical protein
MKDEKGGGEPTAGDLRFKISDSRMKNRLRDRPDRSGREAHTLQGERLCQPAVSSKPPIHTCSN